MSNENNVIGYKGTTAERLVNWRLLLLLRRTKPFHGEREAKWYREEFDDYRKVS